MYIWICLNENLSLPSIHRWQIWQTKIRRNYTLLVVEDRDLLCACYATVSRFLKWPWANCLVTQTPYGPWKEESMVSRKIFLSIVCMFLLELLLQRSASFNCDRLFSHMSLVYLFLWISCIYHLRGEMNPSMQSQKLNVPQTFIILFFFCKRKCG